MKIALLQLPHFYEGGRSRPPEYYPLGLGHIASVLRQHGIDREGIDLWQAQATVGDALETVDLSPFDAICVSAYSTQYSYLKPLTLGLKERYPAKPIICGGPGPTFSAEAILRDTGVDFCVIGEGERTIVELLDRLDVPGGVAGLAFVDDGALVRTAERPYVRDLDALPLPDREVFDFEAVVENKARQAKVAAKPGRRGSAGAPRRSADIIAGRGCPYACEFCSKTFKGCRLRSVDALMDEVALLKDRHRVDHLEFGDELVVTSERRIQALCDRLKGFGLTWSCQGRIDKVNRDILAAMKEAGCTAIGYGVESVTQSILDRMNKHLDADDIVPVIRMTREAGIEPIIQYMYGYPGESDETIAATIRFFDEIDQPFIGSTVTPIPGSPLYERCRAEGLIQDEDDYLSRLDSGYNLNGAGINLTGFSDAELARKKRIMQARITHNYLKRRPLEYARYVAALAIRKLRSVARRLPADRAA